jgi:hypothetical protein
MTQVTFEWLQFPDTIDDDAWMCVPNVSRIICTQYAFPARFTLRGLERTCWTHFIHDLGRMDVEGCRDWS